MVVDGFGPGYSSGVNPETMSACDNNLLFSSKEFFDMLILLGSRCILVAKYFIWRLLRAPRRSSASPVPLPSASPPTLRPLASPHDHSSSSHLSAD
ncbi:hypothetical protein AKJ16_DCAP05969 [Drosera capensis]